jgi:hypothetical protein
VGIGLGSENRAGEMELGLGSGNRVVEWEF